MITRRAILKSIAGAIPLGAMRPRYAYSETYFDPAEFNVLPTNGDNFKGFVSLAQVLQEAGPNQVVQFPDNQVYTVWANAPTASPSQQILMTFRNLKGLRLNFNGSVVQAPFVTPTTPLGYWLIAHQFYNCDDIEIDGADFRLPNITVKAANAATDTGTGWSVGCFSDTCRGIRVTSSHVFGGHGLVEFNRSNRNVALTERAHDIYVSGIAEQSCYGAVFDTNGDDAEVNIRTTNAWRTLYYRNAQNLKAICHSDHNADCQDITIGVNATTSAALEDNLCANVDVLYFNHANPANGAGSAGKIIIGCGGDAPATTPGTSVMIDNIKIKFELLSTQQADAPLISIVDGANPGGRFMSNIDLSGHISGFPTPITQFFAIGVGDGTNNSWAGDGLTNVWVHDVDAEFSSPAGFVVNSQILSGPLKIERVRAPYWNLYDQNYAGQSQTSSPWLKLEQVQFANLTQPT